MNLLYLTNRLPYPLHSGYLRQFYFIRELSRRHRVTLLSLVPPDCSKSDIREMEACTERVVTFPSHGQSSSRMSKTCRRLAFAVRVDPALRALRSTLKDLLRQDKFDAAILHGLITVSALKELHGLRVIADLCDANSSRFLAAVRYSTLRHLPGVLWDFAWARQLEQQFIRSQAHLVFATPTDQQSLLRDKNRNSTVVPNGVDLDYWRRATNELGVNTIVFTGALNYPPNTDAASHLIQSILPRVRAVFPEVKLLISGRDPPMRLMQLARRANVTVTGTVDDIRRYLELATVFAAPLRYGAGIQNKVLQALAMQIPVVGTDRAFDGLRAADGSRAPVDVASNDATFAGLLCQRLKDVAANRTPCRAGREFVERHFGWSRSGELLHQLIQSA